MSNNAVHQYLSKKKSKKGYQQEQSSEGVQQVTFFEKEHKPHKKTPVLESLSNEVLGFETYNFIKKVTPAKAFSCEFCEV